MYALHFGVRSGSDSEANFPFGQGWGAGPVAPNLVNDWRNTNANDIRLEATVQELSDLPNYQHAADFIQETDYFGKKLAPVSC